MHNRLFKIAVIAERIGEVELDDVVSRRKASGFPEFGDGASEVAADTPRLAQVVVGLGLIGRKTDRLLELFQAGIQPPRFEIRSA